MKYNYIFEYKLISLKNFKIVSPATFVNKSYKLLTLSAISTKSSKNMFE